MNISKYIGYQCILCSHTMNEDERNTVISLGCVQTWCLMCLVKKFPHDKHLSRFVQSGGKDDIILVVNAFKKYK
jgi:hypothetical protein